MTERVAENKPSVLCPQAIIDAYAVGSGDWSWTDERAMILLDHSEAFYALASDISLNGVREPVLLGDDGRVWDGHHRILAAHYCDPLFDIPVEYGTGGNLTDLPSNEPTSQKPSWDTGASSTPREGD